MKIDVSGFPPVTVTITLQSAEEVAEFSRILDHVTDSEKFSEDATSIAWPLYRQLAGDGGELAKALTERGIERRSLKFYS